MQSLYLAFGWKCLNLVLCAQEWEVDLQRIYFEVYSTNRYFWSRPIQDKSIFPHLVSHKNIFYLYITDMQISDLESFDSMLTKYVPKRMAFVWVIYSLTTKFDMANGRGLNNYCNYCNPIWADEMQMQYPYNTYNLYINGITLSATHTIVRIIFQNLI